MDTDIYYIPKYEGITITSNFAEIQKHMDIGMEPKIEYIPITTSDFSKYKIKGLGFDHVENDYFQSIKEIFSKYKFEAISFHGTKVDISDAILDVQHLLIGDKSKVNLSAENFTNLKEITFLDVKTFKGKVVNALNTVNKAVLWSGTKESSIPEMLPNLKELTINKGSLTELDLRSNKHLERLDVHLCSKLERILLPDNHKLNYVFIENCKILDVSNLPMSVTSVWPARKDKKDTSAISIVTTGDQNIDSLIRDLKDNMENYMKDANPSYSQSDIEECIDLLSNHVISVYKTKSKDEALKIVESTVLKLNVLNDKCDGTLIETNEREQIAEIIILAGNKMGYNDVDITEEWREW
jgi:hypothetical protein